MDSAAETLVVRSPRQTVSLLRNRSRRPQFERERERERDPAAAAGPKPSEVYGFVGSITTVIATAVYLAWAYTPEPWLHSLGITYYPTNKQEGTMKSSTTSGPMALAAAVLAVLLSSTCTVDATVATTCKAAAASDVRVNLQLCLSQLGNQRGASDADAWGLAKVASLAGVNSAALAADDIKALLAGSPSIPMKPALAKCAEVYNQAGITFAEANDEINRRAYAAGKKKLDEALALAQQCNAAFGIHSVTLPQPLAQHTVDSIQIAIIAEAITSLIK